MMNPNNLFADIKCQSVQKNTILGIFIPVSKEKQSFTVLNIGAGNARISGNNQISDLYTTALYQQWSNNITLREVLQFTGAKIVENVEDAEVNLSLDSLEKDTLIKLFS